MRVRVFEKRILYLHRRKERMAELRLTDMSKMKQARRLLRRSGIRLTVRNGRVYTIKATAIEQPRTAKQLKNWAIFTEANRLTDRDLRENSRKRMWRRRAIKEGYKTARGCAKAYYVKMIKEGRVSEKSETEMISDMRKGWIIKRPRRSRPVWESKCRSEKMNLDEVLSGVRRVGLVV